jgi:predicted nucleic acid-binding protein
LDTGTRFIVPAIVAYELRRELLRLDHRASIVLLNQFIAAEADRYLPLTESDLEKAAELWAGLRRRGRALADPHALDIDVILAAQSLSLKLTEGELLVATTNPSHVDQLVPAKNWQQI